MNLLITISLIIQFLMNGSSSSKDLSKDEEAGIILENGKYHIENGIVIIDETGGKN